ncbi:MAG: DUF402 domain-containing protein [Thermomicrobiales bacterium]
MERVRAQWRYDGEIAPALKDGEAIAWEYASAETGTTGRSFVLLEFGVKLTIPPIWIQRGDPLWYVDLAIVRRDGDLYRIIDLDVDLIVPTDGRPYRTLDLDELADAVEAGEFPAAEAMDGLRRWQRFLDAHIHRFGPRDVDAGWRDFPPAVIARLADLPPEAFNVT